MPDILKHPRLRHSRHIELLLIVETAPFIIAWVLPRPPSPTLFASNYYSLLYDVVCMIHMYVVELYEYGQSIVHRSRPASYFLAHMSFLWSQPGGIANEVSAPYCQPPNCLLPQPFTSLPAGTVGRGDTHEEYSKCKPRWATNCLSVCNRPCIFIGAAERKIFAVCHALTVSIGNALPGTAVRHAKSACVMYV